MTEKRFEKAKFGTVIEDNFKQDTLWTCTECIDRLNEIAKENEQLKKENSVFGGKDAKHYQRWVNQIKKYVEEDNPEFTYNEDFIIKIALSYTLQSLRNGESLKRFQWNYEEWKNDWYLRGL